MVCCFAGDGAYANGVVLESLNWAAMGQFTNHLAKDKAFGLPVIFLIVNNHYGMTAPRRRRGHGRRVPGAARRRVSPTTTCTPKSSTAWTCWPCATPCAAPPSGCREGKGPYLLELDTYRYYGHSLSDPRNEYRTREEEAAWKEVDPIDTFAQRAGRRAAC